MSYEAAREENIRRNNALLAELNIKHEKANSKLAALQSRGAIVKKKRTSKPAAAAAPTRISARIADDARPRPSYNEDDISRRTRASAAETSSSATAAVARRPKPGKTPRKRSSLAAVADDDAEEPEQANVPPAKAVSDIVAGWSSWEAVGPAPTRDAIGSFHFADEPTFTPNKSPAEVLREGAFGGGYYRPLRSRRLGILVEGDWEELPPEWIGDLDVARFLTAGDYDPDVNKFKVSCGQSIEEWEAAGWIRHEYDVRGWFQWYTRFFRGRRREDDERQIGRWRKCVGETGRWRRMLLKKYRQLGVRTVWDDGEEEDVAEVSPVIHQTCHHWAWEVRQEVLDDYWNGS